MAWLLTSAALAQTGGDSEDAPTADRQAPAQLDQAARLLFEAGTQAYAAGHFDEALARYQNAYQLSQRPGLLYNLAVCFDRLDRKAEAADAYAAFLDALPDSPRAPVARSRLEVLRRSLAAESGGGTPARDAANHADASDDHADGSRGEGDGDDAASDEAAATVTDANSAGGPSRVGPVVAFSAAGAGLVTWAVAGLMARSRYDTAKQTCDTGPCDQGELDAVGTPALVADIGLGVAAAGAITGVILWFTTGNSDERRDVAHVVPTVGPGQAGLSVQGRF